MSITESFVFFLSSNNRRGQVDYSCYRKNALMEKAGRIRTVIKRVTV